jgi:hypothetical protein
MQLTKGGWLLTPGKNVFFSYVIVNSCKYEYSAGESFSPKTMNFGTTLSVNDLIAR